MCNLRYIDREIERRKHLVECYRERLRGQNGIQLNAVQKDVKSNYAYFPVVIDVEEFGASRDEICEELKKYQIYARKWIKILHGKCIWR